MVGGPYADYLRDYERGEPETLTLREYEILEAFARYRGTTKEIALALGLSRWTVQHHTKIIRAKLGEHTTSGCVIRAIREGWLR
jgi:DNA-binding CsgD family transcriptional regulator